MYSKQNKTSAAPIKLLSCRECESTLVNKNDYITYDYNEVENFSWALMISCPNNAHQPFYICTECKDQYFQMIKRRQLQHHHRMYHINTGTNSTTSYNGEMVKKLNNAVLMNDLLEDHTEPMDIFDQNFTMIGNEDQNKGGDNVSKAYPVKKRELGFNCERSNRYFLEETVGLGNAFLSGYSHFHMTNISDKLDKDQVELDIKIAFLSSQLSVIQRKLFVEIINGIIKRREKVMQINV